jgi:NAD+ kinase
MTGTRGKAKLNMDSHDSLSLKKGDQVKISKNDTDLLLIHPLDHNFYSGCRNKLGWSSSIS